MLYFLYTSGKRGEYYPRKHGKNVVWQHPSFAHIILLRGFTAPHPQQLGNFSKIRDGRMFTPYGHEAP